MISRLVHLEFKKNYEGRNLLQKFFLTHLTLKRLVFLEHAPEDTISCIM